MNRKIGEKMITMELLSFEQAELILQYQENHKNMKFGEIAVKLGFLHEDQMNNSYGK